ncbi:hypothetical protein [Erysipelothrix anatis]|uniref:hypothetical protein n=1 Tax=Erysipelothrix anatis TaxID=2683713 RepID=UPI00140CB09A|nr:hypothetical protein [Erysipelothrix anatis]
MKKVFVIFRNEASYNPKIINKIDEYLRMMDVEATIESTTPELFERVTENEAVAVSMVTYDDANEHIEVIDGTSLRTGVGAEPVLFELANKLKA